jgi:hypothetical protein
LKTPTCTRREFGALNTNSAVCRACAERASQESLQQPQALAKLGTARKYVKTGKKHRQRQSDAKVKHDRHSLLQVPDYCLITGNKDTLNAKLKRTKKKPDTFNSSLWVLSLTHFRIQWVKVKVKVTLEQATKDQRGSRCSALLLQPRR